ncbi:hypothetical protein [Micromonospora sp. NPDC093244]|uniref:hypothetical protein n=1 Tax=Micromonospora sp. NPDC093244 TaxID=3155071 RepID=UPI0034184950
MTPEERDARARELAAENADRRQREGREEGVSESVVTADGREYTASSSDTPFPVQDPDVRDVIDRADPRADWHGRCALPRAIEDAIVRDGLDLEDFRGASVGSAQIGPPGSRTHGRYVPPCDSCEPLFDELDLRRAI